MNGKTINAVDENKEIQSTANQLAKDALIPGKLQKDVDALVDQSIPYALKCVIQTIKNQQSIIKNDTLFSKNCEEVLKALEKCTDDSKASDADKKEFINQAVNILRKQYGSNLETKVVLTVGTISLSVTLAYIVRCVVKMKK